MLEVRLEVLKKIIDKNTQGAEVDVLGEEYNNDFSYYPTYDDVNFNAKIAKKGVFNKQNSTY